MSVNQKLTKKMRLPYIGLLLLSLLIMSCKSQAQLTDTPEKDTKEMTELPYTSIPDHADSYTAGGVVARMVDGLGFRYRWATEGLTEKDLEYKPDSTARSSMATMDHLLGLSSTIVNAVLKKPNVRPSPEVEYTWEEKRRKTLENIEMASNILWKSSAEDLESYKIVFQRGDNVSEYPFWNNMNGPIADALWHCGQIVSFRRASGNPMDSRVSVFSGKLRKR